MSIDAQLSIFVTIPRSRKDVRACPRCLKALRPNEDYCPGCGQLVHASLPEVPSYLKLGAVAHVPRSHYVRKAIIGVIAFLCGATVLWFVLHKLS